MKQLELHHGAENQRKAVRRDNYCVCLRQSFPYNYKANSTLGNSLESFQSWAYSAHCVAWKTSRPGSDGVNTNVVAGLPGERKKKVWRFNREKPHCNNEAWVTCSSSSNWILTSCEPQRVNSERSNSILSKYMFQNMFQNSSHIKPFRKSMHKTNPSTNLKHTCIQKHQTHISEESVPSILSVKRAHTASACWYHWLIYQYQFTTKQKQEWTETILKKPKRLYKCIMANTSAVWQQAAHAADQLSSSSCSTRAIQKSLPLNEKGFQHFLGKGRKMDH